MSKKNRKFSGICMAVAALALSATVHAQSTGTTGSMSSSGGSSASGSSWYAPAGGYIGFNAGRSDFGGGCGIRAFNCEDNDTAYSLYGGSLLNSNFGLELGYTDFGRIARGGGTTRAHGINLSAVGQYPLTQSFSVFGKLGANYGRTEVTSVAGSGVAAGKESGFASTYGLGVNFDITQQLAAVVQWDQTNLKFFGSGREHINTTSVGLKYRF